jgi:hypothetical protein
MAVTDMVIELRGHHSECIVRIDTAKHKNCVGVFIGVSPADNRVEHFPAAVSFPPWSAKRKISELDAPPPEVR